MADEMNISEIQIGDRTRKDMGDISELVESIERVGLLHPVVVDSSGRLIAGERRIRAFIELNRQSIPVRVVNVPSLAEGEYAENEVRKRFTASERVAMGRAVEAELGNRQGGDRKSENFKCDPSRTCSRRARNADLAARRVGFGERGGRTYERAKRVVEQAIPEVIEMMDRGAITVTTASHIAALSHEEQRAAAHDGPGTVTAVAAEVRRKPRNKISQPSKCIGRKAREILIASGMAMRLRRNCNALERTLDDLLAVNECPSNAGGDLRLLGAKIDMFLERKGLPCISR